MTDDTPIRLGDEGQILLTATAIRAYADYARLPHDEAQRELLVLMCDARPVDVHDSPERWRYRDRVRALDISARAARETVAGRAESAWQIFTVVAITVRHYDRPRGGR